MDHHRPPVAGIFENDPTMLPPVPLAGVEVPDRHPRPKRGAIGQREGLGRLQRVDVREAAA